VSKDTSAPIRIGEIHLRPDRRIRFSLQLRDRRLGSPPPNAIGNVIPRGSTCRNNYARALLSEPSKGKFDRGRGGAGGSTREEGAGMGPRYLASSFYAGGAKSVEGRGRGARE
jgi:hypothetical protein